jgi:hemerythrin-like domain-containing protein
MTAALSLWYQHTDRMTTPNEPFDGREMYMVHNMLRREFGLAPRVVRAVADGDRERARTVADHIRTVSTVLHHHHESEDAYVWPLLLQRVEEQTVSLVELMEQQHADVAMLGHRAETAMSDWAADPAAGRRETLAGALESLFTSLREHLAMEEQRIVPLMEECVTAAEWNEMVQKGAADADPEGLPLGFGMMMYEGDPEVIEAAIGNMPEGARDLIPKLATQAFAEHSELIYGTATPPRSTEL